MAAFIPQTSRISGHVKKGGPWLTVRGKPHLMAFIDTEFLRVPVCPGLCSWSTASPSFYFNSCVCLFRGTVWKMLLWKHMKDVYKHF